MTFEEEAKFNEGHFEKNRRLSTEVNELSKRKHLCIRPYEVDDFSIIDDDECDNCNNSISSLKITHVKKNSNNNNVFTPIRTNSPIKSEGENKPINRQLLFKTTDTTGSYCSLSNNSFELTIETPNLKPNIKEITGKLSQMKDQLKQRSHSVKLNINYLMKLVISKCCLTGI